MVSDATDGTDENTPESEDADGAVNPTGMGVGIALGVGLGAALGVATDDVGLWLPVGIALGVAFGAAFSAGLDEE